MAKNKSHFSFIDKKIKDGKLKKVAIYGSVRELWKDNKELLGYSEDWLRKLLKNSLNHLENKSFCIKKCEIQRSKLKKNT